MRIPVLNNENLGINRLRVKGGAPENSLFDLVNGYVNASGTIQSRPGTNRVATLPPQTKGMCAFNEKLNVFSHVAATPANPLVVVQVLVDPVEPTSPISTIHFAAPFMGSIFVVAEFESGNLYAYWGLEFNTQWEAETTYQVGDYVVPTLPNGFRYRASRLGDPNPLWAPNIARKVDDVVEPTVPNGFMYTVIDTLGPNPRSGETEPTWPAYDEGVVIEDVDLGTPATPPQTGPTNPDQTDPGGAQNPPGIIRDRYGRYNRNRMEP